MVSSVSRPYPAHRHYSNGELIADGAVHAAALVAGVIAFSVLFQKVALHGRLSDGVAMAVYAAGFFLLFGFSCAYNMAPPSPAKWLLQALRPRLDLSDDRRHIHRVPVAGQPARPGSWRWRRSSGQARSRARRSSCFCRGASTASRFCVYLALGWSALIAVKPLVEALPAETLALVFAGGAIYCVGVAFFLWEKLKYQNAIWHACVTAAAACHFAGVLQAVGR